MEVKGLDVIESCQFSIGDAHYATYPSAYVSISSFPFDTWKGANRVGRLCLRDFWDIQWLYELEELSPSVLGLG